MANAKSSVPVTILRNEREVFHGPTPEDDVIRDIEKVPTGYRWTFRKATPGAKFGEEKVLVRKRGQGSSTIEQAKKLAEKSLSKVLVQNGGVSSPNGDAAKASSNGHTKTAKRKPTKKRPVKNNVIDQAVEILFENGIKPAYRNEVDDVLRDLVKKAGV